MRRLLKADIRRICDKKSLCIVLVLLLILHGVSIGIVAYKDVDRAFGFAVGAKDGIGDVCLVLGFVLLLCVYSDEFKYMAMIRTIGGGISRVKFVLAKFLDTVLLTAMFFLLHVAVTVVMALVLRLSFTRGEMILMVSAFAYNAIGVISAIAIAAIFFYLTSNAVFGAIAYFTVTLIIPMTLAVLGQLPMTRKYHLERYTIDGFANRAITAFIMGATGEGIAVTTGILLLFVVLAVGVGYAVFRKKELDF